MTILSRKAGSLVTRDERTPFGHEGGRGDEGDGGGKFSGPTMLALPSPYLLPSGTTFSQNNSTFLVVLPSPRTTR